MCVTITGADDGEALTARVEGGVANLSFGSLAVEGGEASACVDLCTCAPDAELGDLIVVRADGTEENLGSVGTASSMCCESM